MTERLQLRRCRVGDVDAVMEYRSRPDVGHHLRSGVWTRERCQQELETYAGATFSAVGGELVLLAEQRHSAGVIGEVGLVWLTSSPKTGEIGYVFNPIFGGQGLATEAVRGVVALAFDTYGFDLLVATTDQANLASRALCERLGMQLSATTISTDERNVLECSYTRGRD